MPTTSTAAVAPNQQAAASTSPSKAQKGGQRQHETLVKYDNPINVTDSLAHGPSSPLQRQSSSIGATLKTANGPLPLDGKNLAAFSNVHQKDADAILRSILPAKSILFSFCFESRRYQELMRSFIVIMTQGMDRGQRAMDSTYIVHASDPLGCARFTSTDHFLS